MYHAYVKKLYSIEWRSLSTRTHLFYFGSFEIKQLENNHTNKFIIYTNLKRFSTVQPAKRLYPSRLRTWNFASHVTFLRGFCVEVAWVLRGINEKVA